MCPYLPTYLPPFIVEIVNKILCGSIVLGMRLYGYGVSTNGNGNSELRHIKSEVAVG